MKSIKLQTANIAVSNEQQGNEDEKRGYWRGEMPDGAPTARSGGMQNLHKTAASQDKIYFSATGAAQVVYTNFALHHDCFSAIIRAAGPP
ncbi:hypothetical protein [Duganella sacchari]|uniref:hypothetical protein n=1 Tax=Duganella sacchari TaxID=551987 RepID=UPI00111495E1|nr:hypothetical protein [Duganella sacchari]